MIGMTENVPKHAEPAPDKIRGLNVSMKRVGAAAPENRLKSKNVTYGNVQVIIEKKLK